MLLAVGCLPASAEAAAAPAVSAGCAAVLCKAALQAASLNVFINTGALRDREKAQALNDLANAYLASCDKADKIFAYVRESL